MRNKAFIFSAAALIVAVYFLYWYWFRAELHYEVSKDAAAWGQFGDYVGGVLNPLLSFISIFLLIKSLMLQYEANRSLKMEIANGEKTERLRSFEVLFFNLIGSQKNLFDSFYVDFEMPQGGLSHLGGAKAVVEIERNIDQIKKRGGENSAVSNYLEKLDADDQIFGLIRVFYITVKIVTDKLSDANGFSLEDRATHFKALINFTDFAQLRMIIISIQFLDYESARYLRSSTEFAVVISELGLDLELY